MVFGSGGIESGVLLVFFVVFYRERFFFCKRVFRRSGKGNEFRVNLMSV